MSDLLRDLPADQRRLLTEVRENRHPAASPMLAQLSDRREFGEGWIFERKLDGVRALAVRRGGSVRLLSRTGQVMNNTYPELVEALEEQRREDFTVDGEIVAFTRGRTDFARLQQRMQITGARRARAMAGRVAVYYYLFDLPVLDGIDTTRLPLRVRKSLLRRAVDFRSPLRLTPHRNHGGQKLLDRACSGGWEGLIAKRAAGLYLPRRSPDWLKLKCERGQEFVIGGFTEPGGTRAGFGALLLGYYRGDKLRYGGKVGTGYDRATLLDLRRRLDALATARSPFADRVQERTVHWARPELVAQVAFTEWTRDGMLRHPRYLGLRTDKRPEEVVREEPSAGTGRPGTRGG